MYKNILIAFLTYSFHLIEPKIIAKITTIIFHILSVFTWRTLISSDFIFSMAHMDHFASKIIALYF